jgi:hypothetical protein
MLVSANILADTFNPDTMTLTIDAINVAGINHYNKVIVLSQQQLAQVAYSTTPSGSNTTNLYDAASGKLLLASVSNTKTGQIYYNVSVSAIDSSSCTLIDTDFDIDDMMAIPVIVATKNVVGIITTEGFSRPAPGAAALSRLLAEPGTNKKIPIIVGLPYSGGSRDISVVFPSIPPLRQVMEQANLLMTYPLETAAPQIESIGTSVANAVANCNNVSVLLIGPFTSFVQYSPSIMQKISTVVMQGKPYNASSSDLSFNCEYDLAPCKTAYETQLLSLNPVWVDVRKTDSSGNKLPPSQSFYPSLDMVNGLGSYGLPGTMKATLTNYQEYWNQYNIPPGLLNPLTNQPQVFKGTKSLLWDQTAALYMIRPDLYSMVSTGGNHMEPWVSADDLRALWTSSINLGILGN